jgi:geranylgeranyl reductase family protein
MVAKIVASNGYEVTILEKRGQIGTDKCAGLVTPRVIELADAEGVVKNEIKGAIVHSPRGKELVIGGDKIHAVVIDREKFDQQIVKKAIKEGAECSINTKAIGARKKGNKIVVMVERGGEKWEIECDILVGADGVNSAVRKWFGFPSPKEIVHGYQIEASNVEMNREFVDIFIGEKFAPGFFSWIIPIGDRRARIGCCIKSRYSPKSFVQKILPENAIIEKKRGGSIPFGPLDKTYNDGVLLVGDAAAQVKSTSGGGLYPGLVCARHCGDVIVEALAIGDSSATTLKEYQKRWEKEIGKELAMDWKLRKIFLKLDDSKLEAVIKFLDNPKIISIINEYGDIDYPSKLAFKLAKKMPLKFASLMVGMYI